MKAHSVMAAALVAGAVGLLQATSSEACTDSKCTTSRVAMANPLQLSAQATTAKSSTPGVRSKKGRKAVRATKKAAPVQDVASTHTPPEISAEDQPPVAATAATADGGDAPLPVVAVRTTREPGDDIVPVVSPEEFNELDRVAATPSLLVSTISNYIGGPVATDQPEETTAASNEAVTPEAAEAFAAEQHEQPAPQPAMVALEYILMTFGGALAAAAAIRVFVV